MRMTESDGPIAAETQNHTTTPFRKERDKHALFSTRENEDADIKCLCDGVMSKLNLRENELDTSIIHNYIKYLKTRLKCGRLKTKTADLTEAQNELLLRVTRVVQKYITNSETGINGCQTSDNKNEYISRSPMRSAYVPLYQTPEPYPRPQQAEEDIFERRVVETETDLLEQIRIFSNEMKNADNLRDFVLSYFNLLTDTGSTPPPSPSIMNFQNIPPDLPTTHNNPFDHHRQSRQSFSSTSSTTSSLSPPVSPSSSLTGGSVSPAHVNMSDLTIADMKYLPTTVLDKSEPMTIMARFDAMLDRETKRAAWIKISQMDLHLLGQGDADNDTQLMILIMSKNARYMEFTYCIVERFLKEAPEYLTMRNTQEMDALLLAAIEGNDQPILAAYLAEAQIRAGLNPDQSFTNGDTIIHKLAACGDRNLATLKELLNLRDSEGQLAFNVNARNSKGCTPVHVACKIQTQGDIGCTGVVKELLLHGADLLLGDYMNGNSPIHILVQSSADLELVELLIDNLHNQTCLEKASELVNRQKNTFLHLACGRNDLSLEHQKALVRILYNFPWQVQLKNCHGQVPSYLIDASRKSEIKAIFHGRQA